MPHTVGMPAAPAFVTVTAAATAATVTAPGLCAPAERPRARAGLAGAAPGTGPRGSAHRHRLLRLLLPCLAVAMPALCRAAEPPALPVEPGAAVYELLPEHSFVHFEVLHFGASTTRGRFGPVQGEVLLEPRAGRGELSLRIPTASVDTGVGVFNARLRQEDLLDSTGHPEAFFVARQFRFADGRVAEVRGEFTLRGISQPLSLKALSFGCRDDAGTRLCGGDFEGELRRSDFGATLALPLVADRVRLVVQVEARRR